MDLATWRKDNGLTQTELASQLGCTQSAVCRLENGQGRRRPSVPLMRAISRVTAGAVTLNDFADAEGVA